MKNDKQKKKEEASENSLGIRATALVMTLTLLIATICYIPTDPIVFLLYVGTAITGSYLSFAFREKRPSWLSILPTVGTILLFTVFILELYAGYQHSTASAVASFVHLIAGLSALHCFDLRSRGDFSIASLIGLALLAFLMGVGRDVLFGIFVFIYVVLAGLQMFFDSSSRSHELGPSRNLGTQTTTGKSQNIWQTASAIEIGSVFALLPVLLLPALSFVVFLCMPRSESLLQSFIDSMVRARMPLPATLTGQLGKGGRSQALRGGAEQKPQTDNSSFTVKGGEHGTAGGAGKAGTGPGRGGKSNVATQVDEGKGNPDLDISKLEKTMGAKQLKAFKARLEKEKTLNEAYEKEGVDMNTPQTNAEEIVLKVAGPQRLYIRKFAMNGFDGRLWKRALPDPPKVIRADKKADFDLTTSDAVYVPPNLPTLEVKQEFRAEVDLGYIMPASWIPQIVRYGGEEIRMDDDATLKATEKLSKGKSFTVISQAPVYDLEMMSKQPLETLTELDDERKEELRCAQASLDLTLGVTDEIAALARQIAPEPNSNWFTRALKIQDYLKKNYRYENDGLFKEQPNNQSDSVASDFLFKTKSGSCRHFATAHALLCRSHGIPTRLVMGYLPGTANKDTGYSEVRRKDAHVWTEVYIPYWNWVPFDATPSGQLPAHEEGGNPLSKFIRSGLANPFAQEIRPTRKQGTILPGLPTPGGTGEKSPLPPPPAPKEELKLPLLGSVDAALMQNFARGLALIILAALSLLALRLLSKVRRQARVKQLLATHKPSTLVYLEVLDELKRYEIVKHPNETVDEVNLRLQEKWQELSQTGRPVDTELAPVVSNFMALYTADRFGGEDNLAQLTQIMRRIKSLTGSSQAR